MSSNRFEGHVVARDDQIKKQLFDPFERLFEFQPAPIAESAEPARENRMSNEYSDGVCEFEPSRRQAES